jgi:hypothetical protein
MESKDPKYFYTFFRPDLETLFLLDMIAAWHSAQQAELGLFNHKRVEVSPLAIDEEARKNMRPYRADILAHDIWIRFAKKKIFDMFFFAWGN